MDEIKDIVNQVVNDMSSRGINRQEKIQNLLFEAVGEKAFKHIKILDLNNEKLFVNVDSSAWLFQMNIRKRKVLEILQNEITGVKNIIFRIGKID